MSLSRNPKLYMIAKQRCRELRQRQTKAEKIFWEAVRNRKFFDLKFYRQHPLFYDLLGNESYYIADFYCHEKRIVIEIDGIIHKYQKDKDKERTEVINYLGLKVVRFNNDDIEKNINDILEKLKKRLSSKCT